MSSALPTSEWSMNTPDMSPSGPFPSSHPSKPQRVLACVRCQRRKIKCDRRFPCQHCNTSRVQCVLATLTPRVRRRRRFPERELLERLRKYEDLLRQNNIKFEPVHKDPVARTESPKELDANGSDDEHPEPGAPNWSPPSTTVGSEKGYEAKSAFPKKASEDETNSSRSLFHSLTSAHGNIESDSDSSEDLEIRDVLSNRGWQHSFGANDHLLFGLPNTEVDLSTLHPEPAHMFRLWQIYLDNVNPLLKITHTSSLQGRIIDAASNVNNIEPILEALMFSIYCMALLSLTVDDDYQAIFGSSKKDLLTRFQLGCQQALLKCGFLWTSDRECLTALYLYLVSVEPNIGPRSLSSMLGIAIRIAERMKIHSESALAKCTVFEAELRRRLWWSLVLFDARVSEISDHKCTVLNPTWDCRIPLNVNDSNLRPEMKEPPAVQEKSTDSLFIIVRCELGEFIRHAAFHLDFTTPALKLIINNIQHDTVTEATKLDTLEKMIEGKYLNSCDPENPVHFLTIWFTRLSLAKCRLLELHSRYYNSPLPRTEAQCDAIISRSLDILEIDTKIATSPLTKGLIWMPNQYFPFVAYMQILQDLRRQPTHKQAEQAWEVMSINFAAHVNILHQDGGYRDVSSTIQVFVRIVLLAWEAREAALKHLPEPLIPPSIVSNMRQEEAQIRQNMRNADTETRSGIPGVGTDDFPLPASMEFHSHSLHDDYMLTGPPEAYPDMLGQSPFGFDINQINWADWGLGDNGAAERGH